jgi:hypothetical protein
LTILKKFKTGKVAPQDIFYRCLVVTSRVLPKTRSYTKAGLLKPC